MLSLAYGAAASPITQAQSWENIEVIENRLLRARREFGGRLVASTKFDPNSAITLHWLYRLMPEVPIIYVDTQHEHPLNTMYREELLKLMPGLNLHVERADQSLNEQLKKYGERWKQGDEGLKAHFEQNKVAPFRRALKALDRDVWISGRRRSQTQGREDIPIYEVTPKGRIKINYMADLTDQDVLNYMASWSLPVHPEFPHRVGEFFEPIGHNTECGLHMDGSGI